MTAEERLQAFYATEKSMADRLIHSETGSSITISPSGFVYLAPQHIDLIANLVVERLERRAKE